MLLSARLVLSGQDVTLWTRTREQAETVCEQGVELETVPGAAGRRIRMRAAPFADAKQGGADLVFVTVKQTALSEDMLRHISYAAAPDAALAAFQNGVGHMERLAAALPGRALLSAVTTEGALRTGTASVRHTGGGDTWIGPWPEADNPRAAESMAAKRHESAVFVKRMLKKAGFSAFLSNDIQQRILRKLLINAVINPLTAIWRVPNGQLPSSPDRLIAIQALFRETAHVLRRHGGLQGVSDEALWETVLDVCAATSANRSSMLQDVLAGRKTEVEAMNGQICRMAAAAGVPSPWNEAVTTLVKAIL